MAGTLGTYSLISNVIIIVLVVYIVHLRCKRRVAPDQRVDGQQGNELHGPPPELEDVLENRHAAGPNAE
jgi:hypothetical protein